MALAATHSCLFSRDKMLYWNTPDKTSCPLLAAVESLLATNLIKGVRLMLSHEASSTAVQVNLCQKLLFLHQLTHNMTTDCSLIYQISTSKLQAQNMGRTCSGHNLFFVLFLTFRTISVHNMFSLCSG